MLLTRHAPALLRSSPHHRILSRACTTKFSAEDVAGWMRAERAVDVAAYDVSHLLGGAVGEAFVFGAGRSRPHMHRVAKAVKYELKQRNVEILDRVPTIEGSSNADDWLLIDGGSVVVSVMVEAARERLALERHWEEQGAELIELPPEEEPEPMPFAAGALPGETLAEGEIPSPPTHWGDVSPVSAGLDPVYAESGDGDEGLIAEVDGGGEGGRTSSSPAEEVIKEEQVKRKEEALDEEYYYDEYGDEEGAYYAEEYYYGSEDDYHYGEEYNEGYSEYEGSYEDEDDLEEADIEPRRPRKNG